MRAALAAALSLSAHAAVQSEFIFERAPFPSCHASTIAEVAPGEFLAAWFGGKREGAKDVAVWGARLEGGRWSKPAELAREANIAAYNPVLYHGAGNTLWLLYRFGPDPERWSAARKRSTDGGRTWSATEYLPAGMLGPIRNKPIRLANGDLIGGSSFESYRAWTSWIVRSRDGGTSWETGAPLLYPGETEASIQPAIVPIGNKLRAFVRTTNRLGKIAYADSADGGETWTRLMLSTLPNPNSGIDASALKDGRVVLIYNHTATGRSPLNLAVSRDGETWNTFLTLENAPGEYSYPAIIQSGGGTVHVTYTWRRSRIKHAAIPLADIP